MTYQTSNTALASTLATLGVPFAKGLDGSPAPFLLIYDPSTLRKHGYKGWNPIEAARDAHQKRKPGIITYQFERTPELERIVAQFEKTAAGLNDPESYIPPTIDISVEQAAVICAQLMKNRNDLAASWQTAVPLVVLPGDCNVQKQADGSTVAVGNCKAVSLNASPALLERMGV
jgi:hypothetical protein